MSARADRFSAPACESALPRTARRAAGVYYTPPEIVRLALDHTLEDKRGLRLLDFACGAGEFLVGALRRANQSFSVIGMDIDPSAIAHARRRLTQIDQQYPATNLLIGDALTDPRLAPASFDCLVGNPPYVNIRQLCKSHPRQYIDDLRHRFLTARGNFDLYTLFIERAIELLQPGGRCGLVIPNKWATLDYARPCRELLLSKTTIERVIDLSATRAFASASVYPHILVFRKQRPAEKHVIQLHDHSHGQRREFEQRSLSATALHLTPTLEVEARSPTLPLGKVATISCGTAGYRAERIAAQLVDAGRTTTVDTNSADFITSGNIDRYSLRLGNVRFLNHCYERPRLPLDIPELTPAKRRLFAEPKIVVAGMSRWLEAAWDARGLALGVQVFAIRDFQMEPFYLLALLNSKLLTFQFATRFAGKQLSNGYLSINKGQLAQLPIRVPTLTDRGEGPQHNRLAELARRSSKSTACSAAALDAEIDQIVYRLYQLRSQEIDRIEAHFRVQRTRVV